MKKWRGINKELDEVEKALGEVGEILSRPFHDRAKELIVKLSKFKGVKINHLIMGMGGWVLDGTIPFKEVWSGGVEEGDHEIDIDDFSPSHRRCMIEYYEVVNPGIREVGAELNEILEVLTMTDYLQLLEINDKDMKKLLTSAKK